LDRFPSKKRGLRDVFSLTHGYCVIWVKEWGEVKKERGRYFLSLYEYIRR